MIKIKNISKRFFIKNNEVQALSKINLLIEEKDCFAVVGESGSGKTTLANIILGIYQQDITATYNTGMGKIELRSPLTAQKKWNHAVLSISESEAKLFVNGELSSRTGRKGAQWLTSNVPEKERDDLFIKTSSNVQLRTGIQSYNYDKYKRYYPLFEDYKKNYHWLNN